MPNTLIARLEHPNQYDKKSRTVLWKDDNANRWIEVYGKLQKGDNAIYFATKKEKKILIGKIDRFNKNESTIVTDIEEYPIRNDDFLKIDAFHPEANARTKASYKPYISPAIIDIEKVKSEIKAKEFVSFYIIRKDEFNGFIPHLKENDRIILISEQNQFVEFGKWSNGKIAPMSHIPEIFNVEGKTLQEILDLQIKYVRKNLKTKSNKVTLINNIIKDFSTGGISFKFKTFFAYYDIIHNKRIYLRLDGKNTHKDNNILNIGEYKIYKISHGKDFSEEDVKKWASQKIVVVHGETGKGRGELFINTLSIGDYFYLCRANNNFIVLGRINGKAKPLNHKELGEGYYSRTYEEIRLPITDDYYDGEKRGWTPNYVSAIFEIDKSELHVANKLIFIPFFNIELITNMIIKPVIENPLLKSNEHELNIILYGPPGTGKTYNTVNKALEIIGIDIQNKDRAEVLRIFDEKIEDNQIAFTTFHQSMTYEDFIEGIKPMEPDKDENPVIYKVQSGIFREMCIKASFAIAQLKETAETKKVLDFSASYDIFVDKLEDKLAKNEKVELETKAGGKVIVESISPQGNIIIKHIDGIRSYTVSKNRLTQLHKGITDLNDVNNINKQFKAVIGGSNSSAYWSVLNAIRKEKPQVRSKDENENFTFEEMKEVVLSLKKEDYKNRDAKNYVLIIDEINRGNISQIFGELITLIEEDKRLGQDEALEVFLPYSREKFGVPSNLYILATMNTADRSVEALDAALRRRFSFEFMPPLYDLDEFPKEIDGVNIPELLRTINKGISYLLDEDHQIGHSYFMKVRDKEGLREVLKKNVIPLLKEYFYNDLGKIYMILGDQFVEKREGIPHFAGGVNDEIERTSYHIKEIDESFPIIEAVEKILEKKK